MVAHDQGLRDAALSYAARGWWVFPCKPRSKAPATEHGFQDATIDPDQIRRWWAETPSYNFGLDCGRSGLAVIDVDPRNGGADSLGALEREHGPLPVTPVSLTGAGGQHYFCLALAGVKLPSKLATGVDLKGNGGYVVAPPSIHPNGNPYCWDAGAHPADTPLADLPRWILDLAQRPPSPQTIRRDAPAPGWLGIVYAAIVSHIEANGGRLYPSSNGGLVGNCPLHHDCNPSFSIHPERGWKCFAGCGEGRLTVLAAKLGVNVLEA